MKRKTIQYALLNLLGIWEFVSILICAGEETPGQPMSEAMFYGSKLAGIASLTLCCLAGKWLGRKGLLPKLRDDNEDGRREEDKA